MPLVEINPITGEFTMCGQTLGPNLMEADFLHSELGQVATEIRQSGSRRYYEAWGQVSPDLEIGFTLGFFPRGPLERISAQFVKRGTRGSAWSKEIEREIKGFHDSWLADQLGNPPYQFRWGKAFTILEPKWHSANIIIDYTRGTLSSIRLLATLRRFFSRLRR
jgi:hypothetical protein